MYAFRFIFTWEGVIGFGDGCYKMEAIFGGESFYNKNWSLSTQILLKQ